MVFKNKLTPLRRGGDITKFEGKGSEMAAMPDRREMKKLASGSAGINDYAKASPTLAGGGISAPVDTYKLR